MRKSGTGSNQGKHQRASEGKKQSFNWDLIMSSSQKKKSKTYPQGFFAVLSALSQDLILVLDRERCIQYATPSIQPALGYTPQDLLEASLSEYICPEDDTRLEQLLDTLLSQPQEMVHSVETCLRHADGSRRYFEMSGRNLLDTREVAGFVLTFRDITRHREVEENWEESKARYEQVVTRASEGIAILQDRRVKYVNPRLEAILGYSADALLETAFTEYVTPEVLEATVEYYENRKGERIRQPVMETVLRRSDDRKIPVEISASVIQYGGQPAELVFVRDITERKRMEEALLESEQNLRHLFDHMHEGVYRMDMDGKYLMANPSMIRMLGYESSDDLIGKRAQDLSHITKSTLQRYRTELDKNGAITNFQYLCRTKDERFVIFKENAHLVKDGEGNPLFYEGTVEDITEIKDLENQLRKSQKMEVLGRVASGIAHDFNNILANISGAAQILEKKLVEEDHLKYIDIIESGITLGQTLGERILTFANSRRPKLKNVPGMQFLREFRTLASPTAGDEIDINVESLVDVDWLYIDPHQIQRVLFNLITNAVDAMPSGGDIRIALHQPSPGMLKKYHRQSDKKFLCISVSDKGKGMDEHTLDHLFEPFFSTKESGKGTGLGMTIAYNIMKLHGGWIDVESRPEEGTTVVLGVPAGTADISELDTAQSGEDMSDILGRGEHVLLVDDEEALCEIMETELRRIGYRVWIAADGEEALQVYDATDNDIHLVITDIKMPKIDGIQLLRELRQRDPELPIMAITGVVDRHRLRQIGPAEFNIILKKPLQLQDFFRQLRSLLDGRKSESKE